MKPSKKFIVNTVLISTLGTSPGGVLEILHYLRSKNIDVGKVIIIRTKHEESEKSLKIIKLTIWLCIDENIEVTDYTFHKQDIEDIEDLKEFKNIIDKVVKDHEDKEMIFDISGGRKVISVITALKAKSISKPIYVAFITERNRMNVKSKIEEIYRKYNIDDVVSKIESGHHDISTFQEFQFKELKNMLCNEILCKDAKILKLELSNNDSGYEDFIKDAYENLKHAHNELNRFKQTGDAYYLRNCAEKAWNAIVQATNALILYFRYSEEYIKSHRKRREALDEIERRYLEIRKLGFRDRYSARERHLHELCFYENECPPLRIEEELEKVKKYIEDIEKIIQKRK